MPMEPLSEKTYESAFQAVNSLQSSMENIYSKPVKALFRINEHCNKRISDLQTATQNLQLNSQKLSFCLQDIKDLKEALKSS